MEVAVELKTMARPIPEEKSLTENRNGKERETTMSPYLAARREWDERYGDLLTRAQNWRIVAVICAVAVVMQTAGLIALSMRSKVVPYVIAVDSLGHQVAAGPADESSLADDRLKRATLFDWIENLRTVTADGITQRKSIDRVYARLANGSPALSVI